MPCKTVTLLAKDGLHTRPAALFVQEAKRFLSEVVVEAGGKGASAKSLFKLQLLDLSQGTEIQLRAEGVDAEQALVYLADYLHKLR